MKYLFAIPFLLMSFSCCFGQNRQKADSLFYEANNRMKAGSEHIDSMLIQRSIADYSEAIKLNPKFWQAYRNRARLYSQTKVYDRALADLTTALKFADKNAAVNLYDMRASVYYALGNYEKAISDWSIAINNLGNPSYALLQRAKAEWLMGQKEKSCTDYKKALELNGNLEAEKEFINCD